MNADTLHAPFYVFDLDGTLANIDHRVYHIANREYGKKDWRAFYAACDKDWPIRDTLRVAQALLATGHHVEVWSGRSAEVRDKTEAWLAANGLHGVTIRMRAEGDHRLDTVVKAEWLAECSRKPTMVFEDRASVVKMWRDAGILCAQVAPGEF